MAKNAGHGRPHDGDEGPRLYPSARGPDTPSRGADSTSSGQPDADKARRAGWSDEALYDAITVCSLFQFYNNWIDATGVADMPAMAYEMSGHRLATQGYAGSASSPK